MYQSYCGIDFGTTNSAVSVVTQGKTPELIRFGKGKETIPTAIFFPEENTYCPTFGDEAVAQYINGAVGRFMRSLKRILGTDLMDMKTEVNDIRLSYEDIILRFLKYLKETAEKQIEKHWIVLFWDARFIFRILLRIRMLRQKLFCAK